MFTVSVSTSPTNASRYFAQHLCQDEYYSEQAAIRGEWHGRLVSDLGLSADQPVDAENFRKLCQGKHPATDESLAVRLHANRRALFDFTASAPKTVSIMALLAGDTRLIEAHREAVQVALASVESSAAARVRKGSACDSQDFRSTGQIATACFLHRESRALDPQLHTHCIVFNATFDPVEHRFKALESRAMFAALQKCTQTYRTRLTANIRKLGYRVALDDKGCPVIAGVPAALEERFSKRAIDTKAAIAEAEKSTGKTLSKKAVAAMFRAHRRDKQTLSPEAIHKHQQSQLSPVERQSLVALRHAAETRAAQPSFTVAPVRVTTAVPWLAMVRGAMTVARTLQFDAHLFSIDHPVRDRVYRAIPYLRYVTTIQRLRSATRNAAKGSSR